MGEGTNTLAGSIRAFYPASADPAAVSMPTALVSAERVPPPNPLLQREYGKIGGAGAVRAEPAAVHFAGIETGAGGTLMHTLRLINTAGHPIRMHILPPSTSFFSMSVEKRGRLMPGLAEEVTIRFTPNEVRYYHDTIKVHLGDGDEQLLVPLHAYPAVSELAFPGRIDFGLVPQGQQSTKVLPLRSPDGAEFDFKIEVRQPHADFLVEPLSGVVPAHGEAGIVVTFTPSRLATARCVFELLIAQLNYAPKTIELVGSSAPLMVKDQTLSRLTAAEDDRRAEEAAGRRAGMYPHTVRGSRTGGFGTAYDDPAAGGAIDGADPALTELPLAPSVLNAPPPPGLIEKVAHEAPVGGGSAGGDYVTRARAAQMREAIGDASVEVVYRKEREPYPEGELEGLRVPPFLSNQHAVNSMLNQQPYKMRISDLRSAIEEQQADAARQQEELELAAMASLPVQSQLQQSLGKRVDDVLAHLQEKDVLGAGVVTRKDFIKVKWMLKVASATNADMGEFFDAMDHMGAGALDYSQLQRVAKRRASTMGNSSTQSSSSVDAAELDIALQGPERTRQLKELLFSREIAAIEAYEKSKEVKSFVATGPPLMQPFMVEATHKVRAEFYEQRAVEERTAARAREAVEQHDPTKVRVEVSDAVLTRAREATPTFDPYTADVWGKREGVLGEFQLAVRIATVRARVGRRIAAVQASLRKAGISLTDKHAVHSLVLSRAKAGGGGMAASASTSNLSSTSSSVNPAAKAAMAVGLSMNMIAPFTFAEAPPKGGGVPKGEPLPILPIEPFDETKLFALRVPRRHVQMDYRKVALTAPGAFPPTVGDRPMRVGAAFESGRVLPTGSAMPVPDTWGMPPLLLMPPPRPAPVEEPAPDEGGELGATKALGAKEGAEGGEGGEALAETKDGLGVDDEDAEPPKPPLAPPLLPRLHPRVMARPPRAVETDVRMMLRPMPLRCNEYWKAESIGFGSGIALLEASSLSSKWRAKHDPWADAHARSMPAKMADIHEPDRAEELSEDESDTEIEPGLLFPPELANVGKIFDLPPLVGDTAEAAAPADDAIPEAPAEVSAAAEAAEQVDDGDVAVAPERSLAVDVFSERARAEAELEDEAKMARRQQRLELRTRFAKLNEYIEQPRHQLSLA